MLRLDVALVDRGLVESRTKARRLIHEGQVLVGGVIADKASRTVEPGADLKLLSTDRDVGRGAKKLRAALNHWSVEVEGASCVDIGASTGGFTQVLLEHGAKTVVALDVGHDQLHTRVREDSRVISLEGVNALDITSDWWGSQDLPADVSVVVVDVSFVSLTQLAPILIDCFGVGCTYVFLVKPQFEVGRGGVKNGVVVDISRRERALHDVVQVLSGAGLPIGGVMESPLRGEKGNVEYLVLAGGTSSSHPAEWDGRVTAAESQV